MLARLLAALALAGLAGLRHGPPARASRRGSARSASAPRRCRAAWRARTATLAEDFLDLTFELESGERLDRLLRYETPVRVYLRSAGPRPLPPRPRRAAGPAARRGRASTSPRPATRPQAQIFIEAVPAGADRPHLPDRGLLHRARRDRLAGLPAPPPRGPPALVRPARRCERAAIFLPLDTTPQDVRDCLNEEITQALGPADDLYRLPDTIWNDDNFHGMATPFDMLILRTLYQPRAPQRHVAATRSPRALPRVLARTNPKGRGLPPRPRAPESAAWNDAIETALSRDAPRRQRLAAAGSRHRDRRRDAPGRPPARRLAADRRAGWSCAATRSPPPGTSPPPTTSSSIARRRRRAHRAGRRAPRRARRRHRPVRSWRSSSPTATCRRRAPARTPSSSPACSRSRPRRWPRSGDATRRRRPPASTACAGRAMASATPTGRWRASRRSSPR